MSTYALLRHGHVDVVADFESEAQLLGMYPGYANAYINVTARVPKPKAGDVFAYDSANDTVSFTAPMPNVPVVDLPALKVQAAALIDQSCGAERARYATDIPFQSVLYIYKAEEAARYAADVAASIDPLTQIDRYPLMKAELTGTTRAAHETGDNSPSKTLLEVATYVTALKPQWIAILAALEEQRYYLQEKVARATTPEQIAACTANPNWPRFG